jgi:ankyrin repeat protein
VNVKNSTERTPLHEAAFAGHTETVKALLGAGADVRNRGQIGCTALDYAVKGGHAGVVRLLLGRSDVDVNSKTLEGVTALHVAAQDGHQGIVELLLAAGADVNSTRPNHGCTPLRFAAWKGR